jgi:ADP-dependent phosphofructokinase/glucokinase
MFMQAVIQTPTFLADAKAVGLDDTELAEIAATIAADPLGGDIISGTGAPERSGSD